MLNGLTDTDIANRALHILGAGSINSISDTTKPAKLCTAYLPQAVEDVLTEHVFPRTVKAGTLTSIASTMSGWDYQCTLPGDYLRGIRLTSDENYEIVGNYLYTNDAAPELVYIANASALAWTYNTIGSRLVQAIAARLSCLVCPDLTPDPNTEARAMQKYELAMTRAIVQAETERTGKRQASYAWGEEEL